MTGVPRVFEFDDVSSCNLFLSRVELHEIKTFHVSTTGKVYILAIAETDVLDGDL